MGFALNGINFPGTCVQILITCKQVAQGQITYANALNRLDIRSNCLKVHQKTCVL